MGCSIVQISQILRLEHARTLLVSTRLSILDISVASGFNSVSHFSQSFRRYYQKKPSHYRKAWPERATQPLWIGKFTALNALANQQPARAKYEFPHKTSAEQPSNRMPPYQRSRYHKPLNIKPASTKNISPRNN